MARNNAQSENVLFLVGEWVSDKEKTIKYNLEKSHWTKEQLNRFEKILGRLKIVFTESTVEWHYEGNVDSTEYELVGKNPNIITMKTDFSPQPFKFYKDGNSIYIDAGGTNALTREYFKKIV